LKRLKKAGAIAIGYGIESGSQKVLDRMNKKINIRQAERALNDTIRSKIFPVIFMMYGYPGESLESLQETVEFFKKVPYVGRIHFAITTALPGSELYNDCLKEGLIKDENRYLESLAAGFTANGNRLIINFTQFSKWDFWRLKSELERKIYLEQIKRYPRHFITITFKRYIFALRECLQKLFN
ncbi:MAG: radical SAM protein, partial [Candidatus Methanomethyliales bacterium]|nr:radical SAM protein [Candidatus Methanomethylicales archaeon]